MTPAIPVIPVTRLSNVPALSADDFEQTTPCELSCELARDAASADFGEGGTEPDAEADPETEPRDLDPSDPAFHWHSVVRARGWAQLTLDGSNGGRDQAAWLWRHHPREDPPGGDAATRDGRRR